MIRVRCLNPEVYVADQPIVAIGREEIDFLQSKVQFTERKRIRLCAHQSLDDCLHETFVVYTNSTYMRPSKHDKEQSLHILEGFADLVFFDEQGGVNDVLRLGEASSGLAFYCRLPPGAYHTLMTRSEHLVIKEGIAGPLGQDVSTTVSARWAPLDADDAGVRAFNDRVDAEVVRRSVDSSSAPLRVVDQSREVYISDEAVGRFGQAEMEFLRKALPQAPRRRVRICMHKSIEDRYHEMFIMFFAGSYVATSKHLGKDESVNVLEGKADLVLFDEAGAITDVISLGAPSTGLPFYFRTPRERYHAWIMRSEVFAIHETTEGPFRRDDTIFAPWSRGDVSDPVAVSKFQLQLEAQTARFLARQAG